jgi:hypothetical protein
MTQRGATQRTATTRNAAQYCRLIMPFCDATVSRHNLFLNKKIQHRE